ncbi:MAG: hypothetical protein JSS27_18655 [Planctomycetes bacterium]|nr:hypothetical protein [Planctomycetota bacterium]
MKRPDPQVDQHGFPLPQKFGDEGPLPIKRSSLPSRRWGRLLLLALLAAVTVGMFFESSLGENARWTWIGFLCQRAITDYDQGELDDAIANLDRALEWAGADEALKPAAGPLDAPTDDAAQPRGTKDRKIAEIFRLRSAIQLEAGRVDLALDDAHRAVALSRTSEAYLYRSMLWQRKHEFRKAIDDANQAVTRSLARDAAPLNARAYARAVAGVELKDALVDIENAINFVGGDNAAFIDTRGYLQFLLGNHDAALKDLTQAIELTQKSEATNLQMLERRKPAKAALERERRMYRENLAVMMHHRGEVYEKLGRKEEAQSDLKQAAELGYDRDAGVF